MVEWGLFYLLVMDILSTGMGVILSSGYVISHGGVHIDYPKFVSDLVQRDSSSCVADFLMAMTNNQGGDVIFLREYHRMLKVFS